MSRLPLLALLLLLTGHARADDDTWLYQPQAGDTLWQIARQHLADPAQLAALQQATGVRQARNLPISRPLQIPLALMRQQVLAMTVHDVVGSASLNQTALANGQRHQLQQGAVIRTAAGSTLKLALDDGSVLSLGPDSRLLVQAAVHFPSTGANLTTLKLEQGSLDSQISKNPVMSNRHQVQTPSAVTAVRGTSFRVNVTADRSTTEVTEGEVSVSAQQRSEAVAAGFGSVTVAGEVPGGRIALPQAPDLSPLPALQQVSPAILQWPMTAGMAAQKLNLMREAPRRSMVDDKLQVGSAYYPRLENGDYQLTVRNQLANGLQGYPARQAFRVHAFPTPPLVVSPAPDTRLRQREVRFVVSGDIDSRYRVELARDPAFSDSQHWDISRQDNLRTLPASGDWYWRIARLDQNNQAGPYSPGYRLSAEVPWWRASHLRGSTLAARSYPLPGARYQLTLQRLDKDASALGSEAPLQLVGEVPHWQLQERLFPGRYRVRYRISHDNGYLAEEPEDILLVN